MIRRLAHRYLAWAAWVNTHVSRRERRLLIAYAETITLAAARDPAS